MVHSALTFRRDRRQAVALLALLALTAGAGWLGAGRSHGPVMALVVAAIMVGVAQQALP